MNDIEGIDDGYTLDGFIAGQPGVFEDLHFRYRPVSPLDERRCAVKQDKVSKDKTVDDEEKEIKIELLILEMVLAHVGWWNLTDPQTGERVDKNVAAVIRYFPGYRYERLMQIVRLGFASDPQEGDQTAQSLEEAEKNSQPA